MAISAFDDRSAGPPTDEALAATLGATHALWSTLRAQLAEDLAPSTEEWGFTSRSTGWGLRVRRAERIIVYLTPGNGTFLASFVLGERAVAAARASELPRQVIAAIEAARKYAEGRGVRLEVQTEDDARAIRLLAQLKEAH
jgi:hypothetical protein